MKKKLQKQNVDVNNYEYEKNIININAFSLFLWNSTGTG